MGEKGQKMDQKQPKKREYVASKSDEKTKARVLGYMRGIIPEGGSARIPYKDIAKALGCSYGAVKYNVTKLYEGGVITFEDDKIRII